MIKNPEPLLRLAGRSRERELGKLPGDMSVEGENFKLRFLVVTSIVISLLLTGIRWLCRYFF